MGMPITGKTAGSGETQRRALVVDDHLPYRVLATALLERRGFAVEGAADAEEALEQLQHGAFDLLLLDLHMPGMAGRELCRVIRRDIGLREMPILAYTADGLAASNVVSPAGGFDDVLIKPVSAPNLDRILAHCFPEAKV